MALPKLDTPTFELTVPSSKERLSVRPFLVKEEKILLMALQGGEIEDMTRATKQIINNCIVTSGFDIDALELYDLEYILLQIRMASQGETTKIKFLARENTDCPECSKPRVVEVNLKDAKIQEAANHNKKVTITDTMGIIMKYPSAKMMMSIEKAKSGKSLDEIFKVIWACVESVYDEDKIHKASEVTIEEGLQFLESLKGEQFAKIDIFFQTMPKLRQNVHIKCGICEFEQDYLLEGLESFFG